MKRLIIISLIIFFICGFAWGQGSAIPSSWTYKATDYFKTLVDDADQNTARTTLGVGTGNSPAFTGVTITGNSVFGLNSSVFQPATDSTTFFQVLTSGGNSVFNADTINRQCTVGYTSAAYPFLINSTDASDQIKIWHNNTSPNISWGSGTFTFSATKTDAVGILAIKGNGLGLGKLAVYDQSQLQYNTQRCQNGKGYYEVAGVSPLMMYLQYTAVCDVRVFGGATEGQTRELIIGGYRTGDSKRYLYIGTGIDAADTASFDGVSEYRFDGTVRANTGFNVNGSAGVSGTLELDDGSTEKITLVFTGGILTSRTVEATTCSALADWTD